MFLYLNTAKISYFNPLKLFVEETNKAKMEANFNHTPVKTLNHAKKKRLIKADKCISSISDDVNKFINTFK